MTNRHRHNRQRSRRTLLAAALAALALAAAAAPAFAEGSLRLLKPSFTQSGHVTPSTPVPAPRSNAREYADVAVLLATLALASYIALRSRSRREMTWLTVFSLIYFGFYRQGCICPVGSVQNVTEAFCNRTYAIPLTVVLFFALPLVFTLFFGRTFCAGVCPLGAVQELVVWKPVRLPVWVRRALSLVPCLYLALAVAFVAGGGSYLVCRYDPFVGLFRLGASFPMLVFGVALLVLGMFVARPYCRFLCPYGVLLGWCSALSKRHLTITPDDCIQCRLCEDACPYDAILFPTPEKAPEPRAAGVRRLIVMLALLPVLAAAGGFLGSRLAVPLSMGNKDVALAERVRAESLGLVQGTTIDTDTFRLSKRPEPELYAAALAARNRFRFTGWLLGGFMGLVIGGRLLGLAVRRRRADYVPDTETCFSCARCFASCPMERQRLKQRKETAAIG